MATLSPSSNTTPSSPEEAEQVIRHICHHGFRTSDEIQQAIHSLFLPFADQILALPKATHFTDKVPSGSVVSWALTQKCYPLLRYLIQNGWNINQAHISTLGCPSLLGTPAVLRDTDLTRFLLAQGIDPALETPRPRTPVYARVALKLLHSHGANLSYAHALHGAAYGGPSQIPIIRHLLDTQAVNVDELDVYHVPHTGTPLLAAIAKGHVEIVRVLLGYGAHPLACIKSPYEMSAKDSAKGLERTDEEASKEILKLLEEATGKRKKEGRLGGVPVTGECRLGASITTTSAS